MSQWRQAIIELMLVKYLLPQSLWRKYTLQEWEMHAYNSIAAETPPFGHIKVLATALHG